MSHLTDRFKLSPLPPLLPFLRERGLRNAELMATLDDGLEDYEEGATVLTSFLGPLLDEWLAYGHEWVSQHDAHQEPYVWLAASDHIEAVQTFRDLL